MNDFLEEDVDILNQEHKDLNFEEVTIKNKTLGNIKIFESSFLSITFDNVIFNHVSFSHVDLSNVNFTNCGFHNCQFIDCKMVGTNFVDSSLKSCLLENVLGRYLGISYGKLNDFIIKESDLLEARFMDFIPNKLVFENVNLKGAEFNKVSLYHIDLSTCCIENILIDSKYLRGVILNYSQMIDLAPILGIQLK